MHKDDKVKLFIEILLKEYELAQVAAFEIDRSLWNFVLLVVGAQILVVGGFLSEKAPDIGMLVALILAGSLAWLALVYMMRSTDSMIFKKFKRCREIEAEINTGYAKLQGGQILAMKAHRQFGIGNYKTGAKDAIIVSAILPVFLVAIKGLKETRFPGPEDDQTSCLIVVVAVLVLAILVWGFWVWRSHRFSLRKEPTEPLSK